jgi:hypothetical protein
MAGSKAVVLRRATAALCGALMLVGIAAAQLLAISISSAQPMKFGSMVPGATGGQVAISTSGNRTCSGSVTCVSTTPGQAAQFDVSGDGGATYNITLPTSTTLSDGSSSNMTVDTFTTDSKTRTLDALGNDSFSVGATLHLSGGQPAGSYSGSFEVLVEYQ